MTLFYILGAVVLVAIGVVGFLFYLLQKEEVKPQDPKVVPISNPQAFLKPEMAPPSIIEMEYKKRAEDLEEELRQISDRSLAQAKEAMAMIEKLTRENDELKTQKQSSGSLEQEQLATAQKEVDQLRTNNASLQNQLETTETRLKQIEEEIVAIRHKSDVDLAQALASVEQFKSEREAFLSNREQEAVTVQSLNRNIEELKSLNGQIRSELEMAQSDNTRLLETNKQLTDKIDMLEIELVKNRAQASGLERICENYKAQLEGRT